jgi:CubicO group peptidase (beta-lactamase class C family)
LNGNVRLGEYMQEHIFDPLRMASTTFNITTRPDLVPRLASLASRIPSGDLVLVPDPIVPSPPIDDCGGGGLYSTAEDFIKLLIAVLTRDERILRTESLEEVLRPQLKENGADLMKVLEEPFWRTSLASNFPEGLKCQYGLAGILNLEETPTGRKPGSISWLGLPGLFWVSRASY